jgi:hypothetical protein
VSVIVEKALITGITAALADELSLGNLESKRD